MLSNWTYIVPMVMITAAAGCGGDRQLDAGGNRESSSRGQAQPQQPDTGPQVTDYVLKGVIKRVEKELEHVRIEHEAIPGFMDAMTMRFAYKDKKFLDKLGPGDRVEGTLRVERSGGVVQSYELLGLKVTGAARGVAAPNISKNKVPIRDQPQRLAIGDPVPDFAMTSQEGKSVKLSDLIGNVVVITFIYTRCPLPDFCPLMDRKFSELAERIRAFPARAAQVRLISLSFDPDHDTSDLLRKHAQLRGATPPLWSYAVASHAELAKIGASLGLFYQPGDAEIAHNLCTAIIDTTGKLARLEIGTQGNKWDTSDFQKTIYSLLAPTRK
jgi:protein SCO1/2